MRKNKTAMRVPALDLLCFSPMNRKPSITLIGAGNLALALAPALTEAGYKIDEIISRDNRDSRRRAQALARKVKARAATFEAAALRSDMFWLCVSDAAIHDSAERLAFHTEPWKGKYALHSSGALTSAELGPLRKRGAAVASLHPMMTFVERSAPSLKGVGFAAEGDAQAVRVARSIVRDFGGHMISIRKQAKALYHAWGAFASPLLIMELALAEQVARAAGVNAEDARRIMEPIVRRTIGNYFSHGAAAAFSGPLVRGDVETVKRHVEQLKKVRGARGVYVALARSALTNLPIARRKEIEAVLSGE